MQPAKPSKPKFYIWYLDNGKKPSHSWAEMYVGMYRFGEREMALRNIQGE